MLDAHLAQCSYVEWFADSDLMLPATRAGKAHRSHHILYTTANIADLCTELLQHKYIYRAGSRANVFQTLWTAITACLQVYTYCRAWRAAELSEPSV